jgi:hypothetical protein
MLGTVLKQYNGTPASRIRPQSLKASRHLLQSRISLSNPTILSSKIQTSAYNGKRCHKNGSEETGKGGVERKLTSQHLAGAKLTWESVVDVGASSSSIPGNGARKLVDGAVMMVLENLMGPS